MVCGGWIRNVILLVASLFFYAWGEPVNVFLMIFSIVVTYMTGLGMVSKDYRYDKLFLILGILYHIVILFIFKYSNFVSSQLSFITHEEYIFGRNIALPIGISFYSFQLISYDFDVYYRKTTVQKNIISLGLYATMFPQLIAGPIVRYTDIEKQISTRKYSPRLFSDGAERFIYGLGKKVLIADNLAYAVDKIWALDERSVIVAWFGAICYTLQIYYDFSGYSDMAIGLGKMFGIEFQENFNYPYIAGSVTEFWRRWHISLSSWFRDYVYIPLGGNRVSRRRWVLNMFVVWLLTGIWHGANWTFICWGLLYFIVLILEKLTNFTKGLKAFSHVYTMIIVTLAWVLFRSDSLFSGLIYICQMFGGGDGLLTISPIMKLALAGTIFSMLLGIVLSTPAYKMVSIWLRENHMRAYKLINPIIVLAIFVLSVAKVMSESYTAFIYFNF